MKTDKEKDEETIRWLNFFDFIRKKVDSYAYNTTTFNLGIKKEIKELKKEAEKVLNK